MKNHYKLQYNQSVTTPGGNGHNQLDVLMKCNGNTPNKGDKGSFNEPA